MILLSCFLMSKYGNIRSKKVFSKNPIGKTRKDLKKEMDNMCLRVRRHLHKHKHMYIYKVMSDRKFLKKRIYMLF